MTRVQRGPFAILFLVLVLSCALEVQRASAQSESAGMSGRVTDQQNEVIPGAEIEIRNVDTGVVRTTKTNADGFYTFPSLSPGNYLINVRKEQFRTVSVTGVVLHVQDNLSRNFALQVGSAAESITVTAESNNINTTDGTVSTVVGRELVDNLPLNGRSLQSLITLAPGVNLAPAAHAFGQFDVNGQRSTSNYVSVDGVSANIGASNYLTVGGTDMGSNAAGGTNALVSIDAVQEFRVLTSSFAPEYGRTPGGQVIIQTRSGANDFHGAVYEYFRNDVLDANDWFANANGQERTPLRFNDYGGVFGGPIIRNNTFFFFSYEGQQIRQPAFAISAVPDAAVRQMASTATQPLLNVFPMPNGPELGDDQAQFAIGYSNPLTTNATSIRLDHLFSSNFKAFVRYNYAPSDSKSRGGGLVLSNLLTNRFKTQTLTLGATNVVGSRAANEFRLNLSESLVTAKYGLDTLGGAVPVADSTLFIPPLSSVNGLANVSVDSGQQFLSGLNSSTEQQQINLVDGFTYAIGAHQIKAGIDLRWILPRVSPQDSQYYEFSDFSSMASNSIEFFEATHIARLRGDILNFSSYIQDTWNLSRELTVTYGLRWDINTPPRSRDFNNGNYVPLLGNYGTGEVTVGAAGSSVWNTQYLNFAPRLGIAYRLHKAAGRETVVRGGAGLFYDLGNGSAVWSAFNNGFPNYTNSIPLFNVPFPVSRSAAEIPPVDPQNPAPGQFFDTYPKNLALPRVWQWNVAVQQAIGAAQTVTVSYAAALGRKLIYQETYHNLGPQQYEAVRNDNSGFSNYQSLQLQYQCQLQHGFSASAGYVWSHSIDNSSSDLGTNYVGTVYLSPADNKGPSDFDIRNAAHIGASYSLPSANGQPVLEAVARGWGLDTIITAQSAPPVDVFAFEVAPVVGGFLFRPDVLPGVPLYLYSSQYAGGKALNPAAFVLNPDGTGNLGRNALRGFSLVQADLSIRRSFRLNERFSLVFRGDLFNVLNHPNFSPPVSNLHSGLFGEAISMANSSIGGGSTYGLNPIFQSGGPRLVQFSLKLRF
jgi:Carboxypeptidase regulatory-like domain